MAKMYTQRTAALKATTLDSNIIDAQRLLIYPGEGDKNERINVAEKLNKTSSFIDKVAVSVNNLELVVDNNKTNIDTKFKEIDAVIGDFDSSVEDLGDSLGELEKTVAELGEKNYAYTDTENTFSNTNTFNDQVTVNNNVLISDGVLTFEDTIDGTIVDAKNPNISGYRYVPGIPSSFNNGVCYDIGEISDLTDLTEVRFSGNEASIPLVQTCELWFTTPATPPTAHQWPIGIYWIDSATGAAPTLLASKNYRLVFRQEPTKIIASIAYLY